MARWDPVLSMDIIAHWLDLMNIDGWIPREQILGEEVRERDASQHQGEGASCAADSNRWAGTRENDARQCGSSPTRPRRAQPPHPDRLSPNQQARSKVPSEFVVQKADLANPPTLLLPLHYLLTTARAGATEGNATVRSFLKHILPRIQARPWASSIHPACRL